ncbi:cytochrome P450 [Archangium lansingense]|uniref:Cytochrome P450 n=1 Tax=Archangium lansingense TaxID=2995310 RepID=A0ABT4AHA1_9BACT|nr:cytochrome P450 [Archangium lansinium]MCY1081063.1 cytochrome P450 [Archangium lansinium]
MPSPAAPALLTPETLSNPWPVYRQLQEEDPVHWSEELQAWFVTRHEDVTGCFRDPRLSANRTQLFAEHQLGGLGPELVKDYLRVSEGMMLMKDGPEHTRLRRQANTGFTAQVLEGWRPAIQRIIDSLLDRVQERRRMDVAVDLSEPLPALVMTELFDIPAEDHDRFQRWSNDTATFFGAAVGDVRSAAIRANEGAAQLSRYLTAAIEARRERPGNDLLSLLLRYEEQGRMSTEELVSNAVLILTAGHVTTIDQLSNGVYELLTHPEQFEQLKQQPELCKSAVEELLRYTPAVPFMHRVVAEDLELRGRPLRKGQLVFLGIAAANRDPDVFANPDRFDITRQNNKYLAFAFGPHLCLGAGLARRELEQALRTLLRRMPDLRLDEQQPPRLKCNSLLFRGFDSLPVRW